MAPPVHLHFYGEAIRKAQVFRGAMGLVAGIAFALPLWPDGPQIGLAGLLLAAGGSSVMVPDRHAQARATNGAALLSAGADFGWATIPGSDGGWAPTGALHGRLGAAMNGATRWFIRGTGVCAALLGFAMAVLIDAEPTTAWFGAATAAIGGLVAAKYGTWPYWRRLHTRYVVPAIVGTVVGVCAARFPQ